jgi:hypothetical protein
MNYAAGIGLLSKQQKSAETYNLLQNCPTTSVYFGLNEKLASQTGIRLWPLAAHASTLLPGH